MSNYSYVAIDPGGLETRGTLQVSDQSEALRRIKEMGLFPTKLTPNRQRPGRRVQLRPNAVRSTSQLSLPWLGARIKPAALAVFTRQLATLIEAGMPLLRGLRLLQEQEKNAVLRRVTGELALAIEGGSSFGEALKAHPRVFGQLFVSMIEAGEISGSLEKALRRLAEFMDKARKIKGKITAAMYYPCAVLLVAGGILLLLMTFVVPRFGAVFEGLTNGAALPAFTRFVFHLSELLRRDAFVSALAVATLAVMFLVCLQTKWGRRSFDHLKLSLPVVGALFRKAAISRFARTLGTLIGSGVPILQALTIVKVTAGNVAVGKVIAEVHDKVKQGDPIAPTLKHSGMFPAMIAGMVDVGEQTGALPEMLAKIADDCDEEVDNAANAMTSLLEPILIVFLAVVVGSIVIAIFLPLVRVDITPTGNPGEQ